MPTASFRFSHGSGSGARPLFLGLFEVNLRLVCRKFILKAGASVVIELQRPMENSEKFHFSFAT